MPLSPVYGEPPVEHSFHEFPEWQEFMHYLYLPVRLKDGPEDVILPPNLEFLRQVIEYCWSSVYQDHRHLNDPYIYVTARRGFATPGNPLNRPGWHCDDFGGEDINYIWSDRWPTRFLVREMGDGGRDLGVPSDDEESMHYFEAFASDPQHYGLHIETARGGQLLELNPWVIHSTPEIGAPGGMRSFFKISFSNHRYNLKGNSHNHLLGYRWHMFDRGEVRNSTDERRNADFVVESHF